MSQLSPAVPQARPEQEWFQWVSGSLMGNQTSSRQELAKVRLRTSSLLPKVQVTGRYHQLPKRIEDDYVVENKELGTGYNGSVYLARSVCGNEKFAVKPFKLSQITAAQRRELRNEVEVTLAMDHPHVARLRDVYEGETMLQLVMECLEGGELFDRIMKVHRFRESDAQESTYQMLLAINYLHSMGIVHRDIKLENFMFETKAYDHLKLIDFGFSRFARDKRMKLGCGTLSYMAPEVLDGDYSLKCDMWSAGVVVFILLLGYMPFAGDTRMIIDSIKAGRYTKKERPWSRLSVNGMSFLQMLLMVNPDERPSAEEALSHAWLRERAEDPATAVVDESVVEGLRTFAKASRFRRCCMSMMAWTLTNAERQQVRDAFVEMDTDKSGTLTLFELKQVLEQTVKISDAEVKEIFGALDPTDSDVVNYSDFLAAMVTSRITLHDDMILETFRRFDLDNTGYISAENVKEVLGGCHSMEQVEELMHEADFSQDGCISLEEFAQYIHSGNVSESHTAALEKIIDKQLKRNSRISRDHSLTEPGATEQQTLVPQSAPKPAQQSRMCSVL
mmetsp:Transcript_45000/g.104110  ORF Transcript_45000/g.104110 Transcript_45000/m.104110 type:complete len:561 (+) Transcript_45000:3-1685(+)